MDILAATSHEDVLIANGTGRVPVAWEGHPGFNQAVIRRSPRSEKQLIALIHGRRRKVEVSASDHEDLGGRADLHKLEVVREVVGSVTLVLVHRF